MSERGSQHDCAGVTFVSEAGLLVVIPRRNGR